METITSKEFLEQKLYLATCEDCGKQVDTREEEFITQSTSSIGKYYDGKGVCKDCLEVRFAEAHIKYNDVSEVG